MLGFRYLWVDRYCIPQDNAKEKRAQIQHMGIIYASSALTIIATAGKGPERGLPGVNGSLRTPQIRTQVGNLQLIYRSKHVKVPGRGFRYNSSVATSAWDSRAWTFQEGLLSRRRLVFTETEVLFQCLSMQCTEGFSVPLREFHKHMDAIHSQIHHTMFEAIRGLEGPGRLMAVVNSFMTKRLTDESDAIDAIRGMFSFFADSILRAHHICGLPIIPDIFPTKLKDSPTSWFAAALEWDHISDLIRRPVFPSWTWAGWKLPGANFSPGECLFWPNLGDLGESRDLKDSRERQLRIKIWTKPRFPVQIQVEFDFGVFGVETDFTKILEATDGGETPRCLHVRGWTFKVPVTRKSRMINKTFAWPIISLHPKDLGPESDDSWMADEDEAFEALGLVLSVVEGRDGDKPDGRLGFLTLQAGMASGTFERLDYARAEHDPNVLEKVFDATTTWNLSDTQSLGGVELEFAEICLV
jgi:hypothetical protein